MPENAVSVVIPVRNEVATIDACIQGVLAQSIPVHEIIVVDSGSTDGTLRRLSHYDRVKVISISPEEFNHGATRNLGARATTDSDFVLFTVADARAADSFWIEHLVAGFQDDEVAAVCGQQIVPHDPACNPVEWFRPVSDPRVVRVQFATVAEFDALSPTEKRSACGWDNVTAMYRRDVLLGLPFRPVAYSEDLVWASDALRAGHALVYATAGRVYHHHLESADFSFRRALMTSYFRYASFGYVPEVPGTFVHLARSAKILLREPGLSLEQRMSWLRYNVRNQFATRRAVTAFRRAASGGKAAVEELYRSMLSTPLLRDATVAEQ